MIKFIRKIFKLKEKQRVGFFIVHGFLGNPKTGFGDLPERLKRNKIDFYMPQLQAHGANDDINTFNYKECLNKVEVEYQMFKKEHDVVYLLGYSMGGVIAGHLASMYGADKLVLIAPAFKYGGSNKITSKIGDFFKAHKAKNEDEMADVLEKNLKQEDAAKFLSEFTEQEKVEPSDKIKLSQDYSDKLKKIKITVFTNFMRLVSTVKKNMRNLDIPTRIYISEHDDIVPVDAAFYAFDKITNTNKRIHILSKVGHRVLVSELKDELITEILVFLYGKAKK